MLAEFENHTFAPFYGRYLEYVKQYDAPKELMDSFEELEKLLVSMDDAKGNYRYAEGKWTVKEVIGHMMDTELVFAYRALRIARERDAVMDGFDQDVYVENSNYDKLNLFDLLSQAKALRLFTAGMSMSISEKEMKNVGMASGAAVDAFVLYFIIAGHTRHHCKVLKEKYLA